MNAPRRLHGFLSRADRLAAHTRVRVRRLLPPRGPFIIAAYAGYGTQECVLIQGRVLKDEAFAVPTPNDRTLRNLIELYKRLETDEVPGAGLRVRFAGLDEPLVADAEGHFSVELSPAVPLERSGWHEAELELVSPVPRSAGVRVAAPVLVPPPTARFGVISDIDDTVVWTNVRNKLRMLMLLIRSNAHTRKPFKGVAAFYRALADGAGGDEGNPIFYVSGSPWNLYTPLVEFLRLQDIPAGPLLLRDFSRQSLLSSRHQHRHKLENIERILRRFPDLPFVLIGDSGEKDPEVYAEIVHAHPGRIRAIYIRSVNPDPGRVEAIDRLIDEVRHTGAQLVLAPDTEFAAVHAAAQGLIAPASLAAVRADKREDQDAPTIAGRAGI
ncbi:App1 family protein [Aromatoleum sp.]|uniref:App1 family protein n=1 Tax=Aromatoleum sp. TaxID=2307007 RepID=UPI002FC6341A